MLKGRITNGPDRLSILMALGSCFEAQPIEPEFDVLMDESRERLNGKVQFRIRGVNHESGSPGMYLLQGFLGKASRHLLEDVHAQFEMYYNANKREGHVTFLPVIGKRA